MSCFKDWSKKKHRERMQITIITELVSDKIIEIIIQGHYKLVHQLAKLKWKQIYHWEKQIIKIDPRRHGKPKNTICIKDI